jgi:hypothetical protein
MAKAQLSIVGIAAESSRVACLFLTCLPACRGERACRHIVHIIRRYSSLKTSWGHGDTVAIKNITTFKRVARCKGEQTQEDYGRVGDKVDRYSSDLLSTGNVRIMVLGEF